MSLFVDHDAKDPGERFHLTIDPDNKKDVFLFLRLVPDDIANRIEAEFPVKTKPVPDKQTRRMVMMKYRSEKDENEITMRKVLHAWVGAENFIVKPGNPEAAEFYTKALNNGPVEVDQELLLDTRLNDEVKRRVLEKHPALMLFLADCMKKMAQRYRNEEEEALENL